MLEMKIYDLYYSEKQREQMAMNAELDHRKFWLPRATDANGNQIFYTERAVEGKGPAGKWDDYEFVGKAEMLG